MVALFNAGVIPISAEGVVLGVALFYGGIAQLVAGMMEFVKGDTFGALAFSSYGMYWMSFWYLVSHDKDLPTTGTDAAMGIGAFLLAWTIFTILMTVVASRISGVLFVLFISVSLTFAFLTIGELGSSTGITKIGGWLGLITSLVAWYASFAGVLNSTSKRVVLPTWPR